MANFVGRLTSAFLVLMTVGVRAGSLTISSVRKFDAGTYLCTANNSDQQSAQTRVVSVDVLGQLSHRFYAPADRIVFV